MKKFIALSLVAFSLAGTAFAQATSATAAVMQKPVAFFGEAAAIWVPSNNGLDDSFGAALSGGVVLRGSHILTTDIAWFEADYERGGGKMEFIPLTAGYQYAMQFGNNLQMRASALAGAMFEKSSGHRGVGNSSRTAFTYGASLGLDYVITRNVSVGVSGKWMHVDSVKDLRERDMALVGINCSVKF